MSMMGAPKGIPHYPCPMCGTPVYSAALTCPTCGTDLTRASAVFSSSSGDSSTPVDWKKRRRSGIWLGFVATVAVAALAGTVGRPWVEPLIAPGMLVTKVASRSASGWVKDSARGFRQMVGLSQRPSRMPQVDKPRATSRPAQGLPKVTPAAVVKPPSAVAPVATPAPAAPLPSPATLIISSTPRGARVQIDGVARGVTPLTVSQLPAGLHRVRISHQGHRPVVRTISAQPGKRIALGVSLPAQPATPAARSTPAPTAGRPTAAPLDLGKVAPQFAAKDRVGIIYRTADYRGQKLLLVFVQNLDGNAQRIIRELNTLRAGGSRGAVVVVVLRPDRASIRKFVQSEQIQIPVLFGTQDLARAYGVTGQPAVLYLVSEDGRVAARQVGRVNPGAVLN
jgi:peroxiredoxin